MAPGDAVTTVEEFKGYDLDIEEVRVNLVSTQGGKKFTVTHVLRIPTEEDLQRYDKKTGGFRMKQRGKDDTIEYGGGTLKASCDLWRKLVVCVEGYKGGPYTPEDEAWQKIEPKIPANHKRAAVNQVVAIASPDEAEKNE